MLKILLGLVVGIVVLCVAFFWWVTPSTQLVDASGGELTSGIETPEVVEAGLFSGSLFDEAEALIAGRRFAAAKELLVPLLESSDRDGETCILLSRCSRELEEWEDAADYGLKAVELLPDNAEAHHTYAKALAAKMMMGENKLAAVVLLPRWREEIATAVELDPGNVDARLEEITFYVYMPAIIGGDIDRGMELCRELEEFDPARGKLWLALAHQKNEDIEEAKRLCEEGTAQFPDERLFPAILGGFLAQEERYEEADECFEKAKAGLRDEAYWRAVYGQAEMRVRGEFDQEKALELLDHYVAGRPEIPLMPPTIMATLQKGAAYEQLGRLDEARAAYEECLRERDIPQAREALEGLQE